MDGNLLSIFRMDNKKTPGIKIASLLDKSKLGKQISSEICDVSWSLLNARTFHLVGACGSSGVFIFRFKINYDANNHSKLQLLQQVSLGEQLTGASRSSWNYMVRSDNY